MLIPVDSEIKRFKMHLEDNPKVVFSAAFGEGKTPFFMSLLRLREKDTRVMSLHPVNLPLPASGIRREQ